VPTSLFDEVFHSLAKVLTVSKCREQVLSVASAEEIDFGKLFSVSCAHRN
jgi:hypothetical protein